MNFILAIMLASAMWSSGQVLLPVQQSLQAISPAPSPTGSKASVTLAWEHSKSPGVVGYSISYGTNPSALNKSVGVGYITNVIIKGLLESTTYYYQCYAMGTNGALSTPSNTVTNFNQPILEIATYSHIISTRLPTGRTNVMQASTNMTTWVNVLTNAGGGLVSFVRTNNQQREFYRLKP